MSAEDDPEDTIKPRLRYAGADLKRIHFLSGVMRFNAETLSSEERLIAFDTDMHAVEEAIADVVDCAIVVVDPISAYMGETKTHENAAVRGVLAKLSALAKRRNVAVLAVMHLNKSGGSNAVYRGQGSIAFNAAARTVWHIAPDPENNKRRFMVPVKNNIADDCGGLAFSVGRLPFAEGPTVQWEAAPVDMNANEVLLATERLESRKTQGVVEATTDWLTEQLKDGPLLKREVEKRARAAEMSWASVRRAQQDLRIVPKKRGGDGYSTWALPANKGKPVDGPPQLVQASLLEQHEQVEHLEQHANDNAKTIKDGNEQLAQHAQGAQVVQPVPVEQVDTDTADWGSV